MRQTITWQAADAACGAIRNKLNRTTDKEDRDRLSAALDALKNASVIYIDDRS